MHWLSSLLHQYSIDLSQDYDFSPINQALISYLVAMNTEDYFTEILAQ